MRPLLLAFAIFTVVLFGQAPEGGRGRGPKAPPKNLKVLDAQDLMVNMRQATAGLGVMCDYCHVQDRSSDEKQNKLTARMMFAMVKDINSKFPDGKAHVTCYTCHRGMEEPLMAPPAQ